MCEQEDQQDSQLINSVYLDNSSMELYHGRLDKRPNAIAVRIRCARCPPPQRMQRSLPGPAAMLPGVPRGAVHANR